jgi:hypothetical protein
VLRGAGKTGRLAKPRGTSCGPSEHHPSGRLCLSAYLRPIVSTDGQSAFADGPVVCEQTEPVTPTQNGSEHPVSWGGRVIPIILVRAVKAPLSHRSNTQAKKRPAFVRGVCMRLYESGVFILEPTRPRGDASHPDGVPNAGVHSGNPDAPVPSDHASPHSAHHSNASNRVPTHNPGVAEALLRSLPPAVAAEPRLPPPAAAGVVAAHTPRDADAAQVVPRRNRQWRPSRRREQARMQNAMT